MAPTSGCRGMGSEVGAVLCLGGRERPRSYIGYASVVLIFGLVWLTANVSYCFLRPTSETTSNNDLVSARLDQRLTHTYLNGTESLTEEMMKTRVVKLGPGSWAVFVNDQRHHETFSTRAAARSEAKRQTETNKIDNES
jgi:hypothetical protein